MYHVSFPGLGLNFTVNRVAFTVGDFSVYWYGIIIGFGFILALLFAVRSLKRYGIKPDDFFDCVLAGLICGIIGARLYFVVSEGQAPENESGGGPEESEMARHRRDLSRPERLRLPKLPQRSRREVLH